MVDDDGAYAYVAAAGKVRGNGCQREGVGAAAAGDQAGCRRPARPFCMVVPLYRRAGGLGEGVRNSQLDAELLGDLEDRTN